jgi:chemotaxis protein MotB
MKEDDEAARELIIIRRGGADEGVAQKGGAWKIAYADFVTAMMAFFLVMWLINSANEATKARVASYFNPIKMNDATPSGRGLNTDSAAKSSPDQEKKDATSIGEVSKKPDTKGQAQGPREQEEALLADPFKALDKLAEEGPGVPSGRTVEIITQKSGDPFDPMVWEALKRGVDDDKVSDDIVVQQSKPEKGLDYRKGGVGSAVDKTEGKDESATADSSKAAENPDEPGREAGKRRSENGSVISHQQALSPDQVEAFKEIARQLKEKLELLRSEDSQLQGLNFDVKLTDEGILVTLSDSEAVSMFQIGSAEPNPALIRFIGKIGQLLEQQIGQVIVRGHTDARRFQGKKFDNWQLSTARAHMASYMLMRGGLAENRLKKIEGYGETQLLDPQDPLSGVNRRVEFVLVPST